MSIVVALLLLFIYINYFIPISGVGRYWDEILTLFCLFWGAIQLFRSGNEKVNKKNTEFRILFYTLFVCLIGVAGNILFGNQPAISAIFRDIVGFIKFPVIFAFYRKYMKTSTVEKTVVKYVLPALKVLVWIIAILGVVSLFAEIGLSHMSDLRGGIRPYKFLASHPTSLVIALLLVWCTFISYENKDSSKKNIVYYVLISLSLVLTMRTKAFVIIAAVWYIKYFSNITRKFKLIYWVSIIAVVFAASYSKLQLYSTFGGSGRFDLYSGSISLGKMYFPIGSGFGTFASHLSGAYISKVYSFIRVSEIFDLYGRPTDIIGDTGFPYYIGQFGVAGLAFLVLIIINLFKLCSYKRLGNYGCFFILFYVGVGLTTESTLLNYGAEIGVILALCLRKSENQHVTKNYEVKNVRSN